LKDALAFGSVKEFELIADGKSDRGRIVAALMKSLKPLEYVHAFYEGGAAAFGRIDEWSDLDLYAIVDDDKVKQTFRVVEEALNSVHQIDMKYPVLQPPWPGVSQAFYRLKNTSRYLLVDFAILTQRCGEKFLEPNIHGDSVFYFNKSSRIKPPTLDKQKFKESMYERLERLSARFDMFNIFVQKEINRGNWLEALDLYYNVTLASLVEALRARYSSFHYDFKMRYIHYELPAEIVVRLQNLYFVKDKEELQSKYHEANKWFLTAVSEVSTTH
jgi:hypothetical protein